MLLRNPKPSLRLGNRLSFPKDFLFSHLLNIDFPPPAPLIEQKPIRLCLLCSRACGRARGCCGKAWRLHACAPRPSTVLARWPCLPLQPPRCPPGLALWDGVHCLCREGWTHPRQTDLGLGKLGFPPLPSPTQVPFCRSDAVMRDPLVPTHEVPGWPVGLGHPSFPAHSQFTKGAQSSYSKSGPVLGARRGGLRQAGID